MLRTAIASWLCGVALAGCHRRSVVDLSCDMIHGDALPDRSRLEGRLGSAIAETGAGDGGTLVVRGFRYEDSARVDRRFSARLTPRGAGTPPVSTSNVSAAGVTLHGGPGEYVLRVTCVGCSRGDTTVALVRGRTDTVDAYLTRFPDNCEAERSRQGNRSPRS